jgi:hypothetical protein
LEIRWTRTPSSLSAAWSSRSRPWPCRHTWPGPRETTTGSRSDRCWADHTFPTGATAGLRLANSGLGPARIISSQLTVDGKQFGEFNKPNADKLRKPLRVRPHVATLGGQPFLDTDYQQFLLRVDPYDPVRTRRVPRPDRNKTAAGDPVRVHLWRRGIHSRLPAARVDLAAACRRRRNMTTRRSFHA